MEAVTLLTWLFDGLLGLGLLWLAWLVLACSDLFKATVLFVAFGLLMALTWVRLEAPDVALAEVAIGAGLTGALFMAALARLGSNGVSEKGLKVRSLSWLSIAAVLLMAVGLGGVVLSLPPYAVGLSVEIAANLESSGVSNPVTAVLINFRGYDTLLEIMVLLLALLGVWSLGVPTVQREAAPGLVLDTLARLLVPLLILVAVYLLWAGAHAPGGAFQAGSVLGAAGVLLLLTGWHLRADLMAWPLRLMLVFGPAVFVALALLTLLMEGRLLEFPPAQAGTLILLIETAAMISIAVTLSALFLGGAPRNNKDLT